MNEYLKVLTQQYADFSGRARRREYWMFTLIHFVVMTVLYIPILISLLSMSTETEMSDGAPDFSDLSPVTFIFMGLYFLYALATLVPSLAVAIRRLHDTGKTGWMYLVSLIPLVGSLLLLFFLVQDSESAANKWGPNPKSTGAETASGNW